MKAVSPTGVSQWSGYVKADTPAAPDPTPTPTPIPTSTPEPDPEPETDPADLAPTGLTAALAEGGGVTLTWTAPSEDADSVTGYEVLRAVGEGEMATLAADTGNTATAYTDATATGAGETYAYQVKAIRGEDRSQASGQAQVQVPHDPEDLRPTGLTVSLVENRVALSWTAPAEDAESVDGYEILRRRPNRDEDTLATLVADTESTATTYTDATANEAGVVYVYRVKALRGSEASLWSNFARIELPSDYEAPTDTPTPTPTPTGLTPATLENTLLGYSEEEEAGTLEPNEVTFDEGTTFRVTVVSAWPGSPGLVLMLTAGSSAQDAALADRDFILEADETVLIVGTTEFSFDDATLSHSDTTGDGEYTGVVIATWADGEPGLTDGETVAFRLEHRDRPEEAQFADVPINVCDRTWWVRNKIVELTPADDTCDSVATSDLASITEMDFNGNGGAHLKEGDFDGLTGLQTLDLSDIGIGRIEYDSGGGSSRLKAGIFDELSSLEVLNLSQNRFYPRIDDGAFNGLGNLTELDVRGFSRNPGGRTGEDKDGEGLGICWSNEDKAHLHPEYPWNPRLGSPLAFAPLTSLQTYNYDADFDTSRITQLGDLSEVWNTTVAVTSGSGNRIGYGSAFSGSTLGDTDFTVGGFDGSFTVEALYETRIEDISHGVMTIHHRMTIDFDRALPDDIRAHGVLDIAQRIFEFGNAAYNSTDYTLTFRLFPTARFVAGSSYTVNIKARPILSRYGDYSPRAYRTNNYNQPPPAPVNLTKSVSDDNVVTLNWDAPAVSGITGYIIEREVNGRGYDWVLPQVKGSGPNAPCDAGFFQYGPYFGLPGNDVGTRTGTSFTYDVGATDLLKPGRTIWSLKFHVYTVVNNNRSLPTTINVGALQRSSR